MKKARIFFLIIGLSLRDFTNVIQYCTASYTSEKFQRYGQYSIITSRALPGVISSVKAALTLEISAGQMVEDVRLAVNGIKPVEFLGYPGSRIVTVEEIIEKVKAMREA